MSVMLAAVDDVMSPAAGLSPAELRAGELEGGLCLCGCGTAALDGRADAALDLRRGRLLAGELAGLRLTDPALRPEAARLLAGWERAEAPLDAAVHGGDSEASHLGEPSRMWLIFWQRRAVSLLARRGRRWRRRRRRR